MPARRSVKQPRLQVTSDVYVQTGGAGDPASGMLACQNRKGDVLLDPPPLVT